MDGMGIMEEWMASILKKGTKLHHERGMRYFLEYMQSTPEKIIELRKTERNFETRLVMFFKWLQETKGLSANSARSDIIAVQAFFRYVKEPVDIRRKLPDIGMKLDAYRLTLEDLQKLHKYGDLATKAMTSLFRDCPARIGDLLEIMASPKEEMMIQSKKENVVGKVYLTPETIDLLNRAKESLPRTQAGVDKMLVRACKDANIPHKLNAHLFRKLWISTSINIGLNETVIKILSFKAVDKSLLTYFLDRADLRDAWKKVIDALPLEPRNGNNGRVTKVEEEMEMLKESLTSVEKENTTFKIRIDNLQKTTMELESKLDEYGGVINTWLEWNENFTEEEKAAMRKKYGLRELHCSEKEAIRQAKAREQGKKKEPKSETHAE